MHMSDALISPAVGTAMWMVSASAIAFSIKKVKEQKDERLAPLMGVLGAFIFAAQMINFSIPGTGSSGHLGGGLILAALLGPWGGLLAMASVLTIQALFFGDGGLLALGCNIFNLGVVSCFIAYPLIYKTIMGSQPGEASRSRILWASLLGAVVALQLGAFGVVLETRASGISELPLARFALLMQPIHLAIGLVEGFATTAVILFVHRMQPSLLENSLKGTPSQSSSAKPLLLAFIALTVLLGGLFSWFASSHPDGLEWATARTAQTEELATPDTGLHRSLGDLQSRTAFLPDYDFKQATPASEQEQAPAEEGSWVHINAGTSISGLVGGLILFIVAMGIGLGLGRKKRPAHV